MRALPLVALAFALGACGSPARLDTEDASKVAHAQLRITNYCLDGGAPPEGAVDTLIRIAKRDPDASDSYDDKPMRRILLETMRELRRGCDSELADDIKRELDNL